MQDKIITLTIEELVGRLIAGDKLQPINCTQGYCVYDKDNYGSPFRFIRGEKNEPMDAVWTKAKWRIYEEPNKFWEPKDGKLSWFIDVHGDVIPSSDWSSNLDKRIINFGNVFETKHNAEKYIDCKKAERRLRKAVWELNKGPAPKFTDDAYNFTICIKESSLRIDAWYNLQINPDWLWFNTIELADKLAETHKEDLLLYLHGV